MKFIKRLYYQNELLLYSNEVWFELFKGTSNKIEKISSIESMFIFINQGLFCS